jgi:hypothetical protein
LNGSSSTCLTNRISEVSHLYPIVIRVCAAGNSGDPDRLLKSSVPSVSYRDARSSSGRHCPAREWIRAPDSFSGPSILSPAFVTFSNCGYIPGSVHTALAAQASDFSQGPIGHLMRRNMVRVSPKASTDMAPMLMSPAAFFRLNTPRVRKSIVTDDNP